MTDANDTPPNPDLVGIIAAFEAAGIKVADGKLPDAVRAVLAQLRQEQAINAQLRRAHRHYVAACICGIGST